MSLSKLHQKIFGLLLLLLPVQLGRHFWPDWSFVLGLRVDYLAPTVYLTDILVFVILGLWGVEKLKDIKPKILNSKYALEILKTFLFPFSAFIFLLLNCSLAQNQGAAFYKLIKIIKFLFLGLYVAKNNYALRVTRYVLPWTVIYSSLIALAQFLKQASLNGAFYWLGERTFNAGSPGIAKIDWVGHLLMRPYATFPHPNVLAGFTLVSLILIFNSKPKKITNLFASFLGIITILISFSRSAWLVGLFVGWWALKGLRVNALRVMGYALLSLAVGLLLISAIGGSALGGKLPIFAGDSFSQRMGLNNVAFQLIKQSSLVGVGLNNFIPQLSEFPQSLTSIYWLQPVHNIYLLIAAETGIIGLSIFLWFLFLTYKKLITYNLLLITCLTAILALGFFDHYWLTLQQTQLLLVIVLGLSWVDKNPVLK